MEQSLLARRLSALSKHVKGCMTTCKRIKEGLTRGESPIHSAAVEVEKLKRSTERLVEELRTAINNTEEDPPGEGLIAQLDEFTQIQLESEDLQVELDIYMKSQEPPTLYPSHSNLSPPAPPPPVQFQSHLPKLQMANFSGDVLRWTEFWDRFSSVVDRRSDIPDVDKLAYLVGSLDGEASQAIEGLELTNSNYKIAVTKLKERFGKPNIIIDAHYAALFRVPPAKAVISDCRRVLDTIERHLRTLETLGEDVNHNQLRTTILEKFPQDIVYELRMDMSQNGHSVRSLRDSLEKIVSARETSYTVSQNTRSNQIDETFTTESLLTTEHCRKTAGKNVRIGTHSQGRRLANKVDRHKPRYPSSRHSGDSSVSKSHLSSCFHSNRRKNKQQPSGPPMKKRKLECIYCNADHFSDACTKVQDLEERKRCLVQLKRCFQCLREDHFANQCQEKRKCYHCGTLGHHRSLCQNRNIKTSSTFMVKEHLETILPTAMAVATSYSGAQIHIRILFDTGSQRTYLTDSLAKSMHLENIEESDLTIYTFGSMKPKHIRTSLVTFKITSKDGEVLEIPAYTVPRISGPLAANFNLKSHICKQYPELTFADDSKEDKPADLLIGSDMYYTLMTGQIKPIQKNLYLVESKLGWILSGQQDRSLPTHSLSFLTYVSSVDEFKDQFFVPDPPLNDDNIKEIWDLETIGIKDSPKILEQDEIIEFFNKTTRFEDGRYQVKWPWIQYPTELPLNLGLAIGRLTSLIRRLDTQTLDLYDQVLKSQLDLGVIEVVDNPEDLPSHPVHYLAHHCVVQEGKTTKLRVVYDASAKARGQHSLNDYLFKGPRMLEDLVAFLILFRLREIAIVADIEKAFLQVGLQPEDRDVTRFVWLKDAQGGVQPNNIVHLRFKRVPFGVVSSPFLLAATIKYHLSQINKTETRFISDSLYVDNLLCSVDSLEQADSIFSVATSTFNELSMNIREWNSNNVEFVEAIPDDKRSSREVVSVLGLEWDTKRDSLRIAIDLNIFSRPVKTKRDTLRMVASVFDPCGFIAPLTLPARILHQELWRDKCKWDDEIAQNRLEEWNRCIQILKSVKNTCLSRAFFRPTESVTNQNSYRLHCLTDASKDAYAAVVYLRITFKDKINVSFVMSRSRLTPLRQRENMTIPKLELLGVLIGVRLLAYVERTLNRTQIQTFLWTDSQIVISWIRSSRLLPPFVTRRVTEIKAARNVEFRFVPSELNPADVATRVALVDNLPGLWSDGPQFLTLTDENWPKWDQTTACPAIEPVSTDLPVESTVTEPTSADAVIDSSVEKTARMNLHDQVDYLPADSSQVPDATPEIDSPNMTTVSHPNFTDIKRLQEESFPRELNGVRTDLSNSLRLFVDQSGVLRCNAKLQNANMPFEQKYPIILPRDTAFTRNVIKEIHEKNYHVGVSHTLALLRKQYWVPMGRAQVTKVIRACKPCIKYGGGPYKLPDMPPLPKERVAVCPPFSYIGLDYLGPLTIVENGSRQKRWCVLFTCMAVRAIHLELVPDMTTEQFLLCLRRFVAARGPPLVIISDNALQFKLSSSVLNSSFCENNNIQWRFIPELSPWYGGFYERLVGLVKHCLRRTLDKTVLTNTQLMTVIKEVESVLNTRPLTAVGATLEHVLTPADFLSPVAPVTLESTIDQPSGSISATKQALVTSWRKSQTAFAEFRSMFVDQYLSSLSERKLKPHKQPRVLAKQAPSCGDIVQVKETMFSRVFWRVGQISELIPSRDGKVRTAKVKLFDGKLITRSISHLYPLEMSDDSILNESLASAGAPDSENCPSRKSTSVSETNNTAPIKADRTEGRPKRKAAQIARERILRLTENLLVLSKAQTTENAHF